MKRRPFVCADGREVETDASQTLEVGTKAPDFDHPEGVVIKPWAAEYVDGKVQVVLPPCSVVELIPE